MNAKLVLDVCQALYEKHQLITYPRSDCRYLPNDHFKQAPAIIKMLTNSVAPYASAAKNADHSIRSKAWNDKKISAHHAIIPTQKSPLATQLNSFEKNVYQLIVRQYLAQFYPPYLYHQSSIVLTIAGGQFKANAKSPIDSGWKVLFNNLSKQDKPKNSDTNIDQDHAMIEQQLPKLKVADSLLCDKGQVVEKATQAPQSFTDATLLAAMTGINRFVQDKNIKKILKESDGLGTEATRAGIIELLFKRGYLQRCGKQIHATHVGKGLIAALPEIASKPDMTAQWEASLNAISEKQVSYQNFMQPLRQSIQGIINQASQQLPTQLTGLTTINKKTHFKKSSVNKKMVSKKRKQAS